MSLAEGLEGRYILERELGRGGMATVYLARDLKHDRLVALKVLLPELAVALGPERFQREIRFAARLQHPHILSVYDSGEAAGQLWFTMPYVEGESLRDRLKREPQLPLDDALRVAREAAEALGYAHEHGVVHRDVKPENIMLTRDGNTLVADFGIARAVGGEGAHQLTATGMSIGTPAYMSPEQAAGASDLDGRSDIYSLGCVLYEMLAGAPPFSGNTPQSVIAKRFSEPAPSVAVLRDTVPPAIEAAVAKALGREPEDRFATATEFARALAAPTTGAAWTAGTARRKAGARRWVVLAVLAIAVGVTVLWGARRIPGASASRAAWVADTAIPAIRLLADSGRWDSAYTLASRASAILPHDSTLAALWPRFSDTLTIQSDPEGAQVHWNRYASPGPGILLGTTPIAAARIPFRFSRLHFDKAGHRSLDALISVAFATRAPYVLDSASADSGMVHVPGGETEVNLPGLDHLEALKLGDFRIGRYEVTNKEFKRFVAAGGYQKKELWKHPIAARGRALSWSEAMARLVDRTGRPGPASWEGGTYPEGQADYPVTGVSWYEAEAYAAFAGAELPTIYHWSRAAFTWASAAIVPQSNFGGRGPVSVGQYQGVGQFGTYDMAGNAREWCLNQSGTERYILGGGWNDPTYAFNDAYAQDPFDRSPTNGFRLAKYLSDENLAVAERPIVRAFRDFSKLRPVSDQVFAVYRRMYDYDPIKLNAVVDTTDEETDDWVRQKVSFDAAYNHERMTAYLYVPKHGKPPYQAVVFFPGSNAIHTRSSKDITSFAFDFIVKSGRVVVHPIYQSTYERQDSLHSDYAEMTNFYKEHVIMWAKDMRRSIDYLETRPDIDTASVAYYGVSWGGYLGGLMPAVEPRFKAVVLLVAGLEFQQGQPEVEPINFLPRIKIPVLMLNGQYDHYFPVETAQLPMFRLLGSPPDQKRQVISEGGHFVPRTQLVKETLDWLDRYLGPVK